MADQSKTAKEATVLYLSEQVLKELQSTHQTLKECFNKLPDQQCEGKPTGRPPNTLDEILVNLEASLAGIHDLHTFIKSAVIAKIE